MAKEKTYKEIKKALPGIESNKVYDLSNELDRVLALKSVFESEGGHELKQILRDNCASIMRKLIVASKDNPQLPTLLGLIAAYSANMDLLISSQDITMEEELRRQLDLAVQEVYRP